MTLTRSLAEYVSAGPEAEPRLPLFHTCDGFTFRKILASQRLATHYCEVFGQSLLYFFYGKPAYRISSKTATTFTSFFPVALAVEMNCLDPPIRIAPFDTGAFEAGMFKDHIHPHMEVKDFLLDTSTDVPPRVVGRFFETNNRYFHGEPATLTVPPLYFEVESYYSLASSRASSSHDDRASCVEVQVSQEVALGPENLSLVILPRIFLEDQEVAQLLLSDWKCTVRTYSIIRSTPQGQAGLVYHLAYEYMASKSLI